MKWKQIAASGLCGASLLLGGGCTAQKASGEALLHYLTERYPDDQFTLDHYELQSEENNLQITEIIVTSSKFPKGEIHAKRWMENGEWLYADNYPVFLLRDSIEETVHTAAENQFGVCKVFLQFKPTAVLTPGYPADADAEYFLRSRPGCSFAVYLPPTADAAEDGRLSREDVKQFAAAVQEQAFYETNYAVVLMKDTEGYELVQSYPGAGEQYEADWISFTVREGQDITIETK